MHFANSQTITRRSALSLVLLGAAVGSAVAQEPDKRSRDQLTQPMLRVANKRSDAGNAATEPQHPLDPALALARDGLKRIREDVKDYTCVIIKRESINGRVGDYEYMYAKIRNRQLENEKIKVPFSVYMYFLKPEKVKGREVVYVEGKNNGKMYAHEGGTSLLNSVLPSMWLRPDGPIAMRNNRYPITEIGIENLVAKLIEKGERDRKRGEVQVTFSENAKVNKRKCTMLQVVHPVRRPYFDFHIAQIFIDDELNVPIRYAAYEWPDKPGDRPPVIEEYTYINMKLNVGLTDKDFDHENPDYRF